MKIRNDLPFAVVPEWLIVSEVSDRAVRLYAILVRHADKEGHAFPSRRRLAKLLRCSESSLDRATKELADAGAVRVEKRRTETGDWDANAYVLTPGGVTTDATPQAQGGVTHEPTGGVTTDALNEKKALNEKDLASSGRDQSRVRPRDELFEAVMEVSGIDLDEIPQEARGSYNAAVAGLRKLGATPEEVRRRVGQAWFTVTPAALLRHWAELRGGPRTSRSTVDEPCEECRGRMSHRAWCSQSGWPESATERVASPQEPEPVEEGTMLGA